MSLEISMQPMLRGIFVVRKKRPGREVPLGRRITGVVIIAIGFTMAVFYCIELMQRIPEDLFHLF